MHSPASPPPLLYIRTGGAGLPFDADKDDFLCWRFLIACRPTLELCRSENGCWTRKLHTGPRASAESPVGASRGGGGPHTATPQVASNRHEDSGISTSKTGIIVGAGKGTNAGAGEEAGGDGSSSMAGKDGGGGGDCRA